MNKMDASSIFNGITAIATCVLCAGVVLAWMQIRQGFEQQFYEQYRLILRELPIEALIGKHLTEKEFENSKRAFYQYFDLCNEQLYHIKAGKVSKQTKTEWRGGIECNLKLVGFICAFEWLHLPPDTFSSLDEFRTERGLIHDVIVQKVFVTEATINVQSS